MKLPGAFKKIPRELGRIGYQIDDMLYAKLGVTTAHLYSRYFIEPRIRHVPGALVRGSKIAIYLIFPTRGLLKSHFIALQYILRSGYAPIVVSNLPLSADTIARLLPHCATLILRPNFGYDFGGYKDAVRFLSNDLNSLDHLAIFNDSNWFPANPDRNWLAEAEAMNCDFVGSVSHGGLDLATALQGDKIVWSIDTTKPRFHYGSFSLLFGATILHSLAFRKFWQDYRPANSKTHTIRRGEIGLSQWVITHGFTHAETLDPRNLPSLLNNLPTERLLQIATNAFTFDRPRPNDTRRDILLVDTPDHGALVRFVLKEVLKSGQAYALQDFDVHERSGNFIKKSPVSLNRMGTDQTLRILGRLKGSEAETFRAEAADIARQKHGPQD